MHFGSVYMCQCNTNALAQVELCNIITRTVCVNGRKEMPPGRVAAIANLYLAATCADDAFYSATRTDTPCTCTHGAITLDLQLAFVVFKPVHTYVYACYQGSVSGYTCCIVVFCVGDW